jgi:hypothetical protein
MRPFAAGKSGRPSSRSTSLVAPKKQRTSRRSRAKGKEGEGRREGVASDQNNALEDEATRVRCTPDSCVCEVGVAKCG